MYTVESLHVGSVDSVTAFDKSTADDVVLVTAADGILRIDFQPADSEDGAGEYDWELEITLASGKIYHVGGKLFISKRRQLA